MVMCSDGTFAEERIEELEAYLECTCEMVQKQLVMIRALRAENRVLRKRLGEGNDDGKMESEVREMMRVLKSKELIGSEGVVEALQRENAAKDAQIQELLVERRKQDEGGIDCGPKVQEFENPGEYKIAELEQMVSYLSSELRKESDKVAEMTRKEKALVSDHKKTWMELHQLREQLAKKSQDVESLSAELARARQEMKQ